MTCEKIKNILQDGFTSAGWELPDDIRRHLNECADCRAYQAELSALAEPLSRVADISLTTEETLRLESSLKAAIKAGDSYGASQKSETLRFWLSRVGFAAAAVAVIMIMSFGPPVPDDVAIVRNLGEMQMSQTVAADAALLLVNGDKDVLPSLVDPDQAAYLTAQIQAGKADDILESATPEEVEWLMQNYAGGR